MFATRSASGPMLAPRLPAPTSVGAPMTLMPRFIQAAPAGGMRPYSSASSFQASSAVST
jgi:hypothetical protein